MCTNVQLQSLNTHILTVDVHNVHQYTAPSWSYFKPYHKMQFCTNVTIACGIDFSSKGAAQVMKRVVKKKQFLHGE